MRRQLKVARWLAGALALGTLVPAAYFLFGFDEFIHRRDTPAANPKAAALVDPILPSSATDIYFLEFAGGLQDLERFVRFSVPPDTIDQVINDLITANNQQLQRSAKYGRVPLASARSVTPRRQFQPMNWWTPSSIKDGYYRGDPDFMGYSLRIWADTASGTIFVYQND